MIGLSPEALPCTSLAQLRLPNSLDRKVAGQSNLLIGWELMNFIVNRQILVSGPLPHSGYPGSALALIANRTRLLSTIDAAGGCFV